jgi:hypothetical protein
LWFLPCAFDQALRYSLPHSHGLIRRFSHLRPALDAPRGPPLSCQRDCKEARNSISVVLYFLQYDFLRFWYGAVGVRFVYYRFHPDVWRSLLERNYGRCDLPDSSRCETPCRCSRPKPRRPTLTVAEAINPKRMARNRHVRSNRRCPVTGGGGRTEVGFQGRNFRF